MTAKGSTSLLAGVPLRVCLRKRLAYKGALVGASLGAAYGVAGFGYLPLLFTGHAGHLSFSRAGGSPNLDIPLPAAQKQGKSCFTGSVQNSTTCA